MTVHRLGMDSVSSSVVYIERLFGIVYAALFAFSEKVFNKSKLEWKYYTFAAYNNGTFRVSEQI